MIEVTPLHREKFKAFLQAIEDGKASKTDTLVLAYPTVLGDDYDELITNLKLLAETDIALAFVAAEAQS